MFWKKEEFLDRLIESNGRNKNDGKNVLEKREITKRNNAKCSKYANKGVSNSKSKQVLQLKDMRRNNFIEQFENGFDDMDDDVEFNGLFDRADLLKLKRIQDETIFNILYVDIES